MRLALTVALLALLVAGCSTPRVQEDPTLALYADVRAQNDYIAQNITDSLTIFGYLERGEIYREQATWLFEVVVTHGYVIDGRLAALEVPSYEGQAAVDRSRAAARNLTAGGSQFKTFLITENQQDFDDALLSYWFASDHLAGSSNIMNRTTPRA